MKWLPVAVIALFSCKDAESPRAEPGSAGDPCAIGNRAIRACGGTLKCTPQPYTPPPPVAPGEFKGPEKPNDIGGNCGGVAGFHCVEGLACDMTPEQETASDGMGSCARASKCQ